MRIFRLYILPFLIVATLFVAIRYFLIDQYQLEGKAIVAPLCPGDRVIVGKYPVISLKKGGFIVYLHPQTKVLSIGKVIALTGDSVWVNRKGKVYLHPSSQDTTQVGLLIPGRCEPIDITPTNARFFSYILSQYEQRYSSITANQELLVDHRLQRRIHFLHNYCWVEGIGLLSDEYIEGRILCVSYSWYNGRFRHNRWFIRL